MVSSITPTEKQYVIEVGEYTKNKSILIDSLSYILVQENDRIINLRNRIIRF